jgi:hypothetical protein
MSARPRSVDLDLRVDRLDEALALRDEWLAAAMCTLPADRDVAESIISRLYESVGACAPAFVWVASPAAAADFLTAQGDSAMTARVQHARMPIPLPDQPVAHRLAAAASDLRHAFDHVVTARRLTWDPVLAGHARLLADVGPTEAVRRGVPLPVAIESAVHLALLNSVEDSVRVPIRDQLAAQTGPPRCLTWYGQHEVWPAVLDICRSIRLIRLDAEQCEHLNRWTALIRSCGWWWPLEDVCVVAERPMRVRTERRAGPDHAGVRLHDADGPAVAFPDGWQVHSWHGTRVPACVITDPSPQRIARESNVEVRRCAIERIGWDRFVEQADLRLLGTAPDPGNPDCQLRLYEVPGSVWGTAVRLLVTTNGSFERDGSRRTYGLTVPAGIDHPLTAAAWTYGLPAYVYARLARRT